MNETKKRKQYDFDKKAYDHMHIQVPKDKKEEIKAFADSKGKSLNRFVNEAIDEKIERDSQ